MELYRTESFSGTRVRDTKSVLKGEIFTLGNPDILISLFGSGGLLADCHDLMHTAIEIVDGRIPTDEDAFCEELLAAIETKVGVRLPFALWLTTKENIAGFYGIRMKDAYDYDAYEVSPICLCNRKQDGQLYAYAMMPEPLGGKKAPIEVDRKRCEEYMASKVNLYYSL